MAVTDIATLTLSVFFLIRGASRGFMKSLTVPFSIVIATIISIIYYKTTQDMVAVLLIGLIGPLLLNLQLRFLLNMWTNATDTKTNLSPLSRLGGAVLTLIWGWVFIVFTLVLLTILPPWGKAMTVVNKDVTRSVSYLIAGQPFKEILFTVSKQNISSAESGSSAKDDAKSLAEDPRFQNVLQDPDIQKAINAHDYVALMRNPKMMALVREIMRDPATMKKVLALYKSQQQAQAPKNP